MASGRGEGPNGERVGRAGRGVSSREKSFGAVGQTTGSDTRLGYPVVVGDGVEGIKVSGRVGLEP